MDCPISRRGFIGTTTAGIGTMLLNAQFGRTEENRDWAPKLPPVKIYQVYIGRTGGIYLSRPTGEIDKFQKYLAGLEAKLGDVKFVGGDIIPPTEVASVLPKIKEADGVLLFHLSAHGGDAPHQAMSEIIAAGVQTAVFSQPFSGHGWMYFPRWQKEGHKVVLMPSSDWSDLDKVVKLMRVGPHLQNTKILVVRGPEGTAAACNAEQVKAKLGCEIVPVTVEETLKEHEAVPLADAEAEADAYWFSLANQIVEPSREEVINSARFYLALKNIMRREGCRAVTSSNCMGAPAKGCLAFSKLNDLGLVGACEGDMDSTLTMLMFGYAFDVPGFISDPVFDVSQDALIHFHCTSATKMDGPQGERLPFTIRTQTDSGQGVSLDVENRIGQPVTCAKFINLDTMLISTGEIFKVTHDKLGCRTQFWTKVANADSMFRNWGAGVLEGGVMALLHRAVFYGDHKRDIEDLSHLMGFKMVEEA